MTIAVDLGRKATKPNQKPKQRSDAGEAQTRGPSVSSQALYQWAPAKKCKNARQVTHFNFFPQLVP